MERFGDLLLMERLAAGGMAEVYRARQMGYGGFEKTVALKRILPHFASSEDFKQMFRLEANLSAMLQHPNITQVFANGEEEGYLFLVMEFVDGKNLRQLLGKADKSKFRIPIEVSCFLVGEAAKGLDYAHNYHDERTGQALSIVHRDISPQNIMLGYEGSVKLVDFGIAKVSAKTEGTKAGVLKGKFGYMSPEQARGEGLDRRSDIFAMGIILWELLTQRRLFSSDDELKTLQNVRECKVPRPSQKNPTIPYALEKIVMRALEKDPKNRYNTSGEMYSDVIRYMNDRHPNFISTDFTRFMKEFYKEEIAEEKKRREKLNLEAPAFMAKSPGRKPDTVTKYEQGTQSREGTKTHTIVDADTAVSRIAKKEVSVVQSADMADLRSTLNRDPSSAKQTGSYRVGIAGENTQTKKIQLMKNDGGPGTNPQFTKAKPVQGGAPKALRYGLMGTVALLVVGLALTKGGDLIEKAMNVSQQIDRKKPVDKPGSTKAQQNAVAKAEPDLETKPDLDPPPVATDSEPETKMNRTPALTNYFIWDPKTYDVYGSVAISGVPDADQIFIGGKKLVDTDLVAIKTPVRDLKLPPGKYDIELKNSVFGVSKTVTVEIEKNKVKKIDAFLNKR